MAGDVWDPGQYERFKSERAQPFHDLAALIERDRPIDRLVDLGCGTGELTAGLVAELGARDALGIDSSDAMLRDAAAHAGATVRFARGDLATWTDGARWDVVLANAALQWVPDHRAVLARWTAALAPAGQLAVQVPANADHPSHVVAAEVAADEPFATAFAAYTAADPLSTGGPPPDPVAANVLAPEEYAELLHELGFTRQHVRLQVYLHVLASTADVVEWTKGTTLTRFRDGLGPELFDAFVGRYREALIARLGDRSPFAYPFKRILLWARRGG